jgi:ribosomal protein L21E
MEKLSAEQQADIKKLSTERLRSKLVKVGYKEEEIAAMERPKLMELWAQSLWEEIIKPQTAEAVVAKGEEPMDSYRLELEKLKLQMEEQRWRYQEEKEEKRRKEEFEQKRWEEEKAEKLRKEAEEKEEKRRRWEEERMERLRKDELEKLRLENERVKLEEDRQWRVKELQRSTERDQEEAERKALLTSRSKPFFDAFKNLLHKLPNDPAEVIGYFEFLEGLFETYEVPKDIQPKILQAHLNDRAKSLTVRLTKEQLNDYEQFKEFLLNEYRISPLQLRERFFTLNKKSDETYVNLASKLHNAWSYYVRSRNIDRDFDALVSLICADRMKDLIPSSCLDWILSQEDVQKGSWLDHQALANAADTYMASHYYDGRPKGSCTKRPDLRSTNPSKKVEKVHEASTYTSRKSEAQGTPRGAEGPRKCYLCGASGAQFHLARDCPKRKDGGGPQKPTRVNRCAVEGDELPQAKVVTPCKESEPSVNIAQTSVKTVTPVICQADSLCRDLCNCVSAEQFYERVYFPVQIEGIDNSIKALVDGGSMHSVISQNLVSHLQLPVVKQVHLSGLQGRPDIVDVVTLHVKPVIDKQQAGIINIAPSVKVWFAVVPNLNEDVILTPNVVELLKSVANYDVLSSPMIESCAISVESESARETVDHVTPATLVEPDTGGRTELDGVPLVVTVAGGPSLESTATVGENESAAFVDPDQLSNERTAHSELMSDEQRNCSTLKECWEFAKTNKNNFFVENGLLYHRETILGHKINQLVLPVSRRKVVLEFAHDAPFAGHMAWRRTRYRVRLAFYWPGMDNDIRQWCSTCEICQKHKPVRIADRVPITPIPRDEELPFTHLVMDCIGPIIPTSDPFIPKPDYNYALVVVDKYTRYPMAYPIRSLNAKTVCDCLLNIFMTYSIPKVISSDCGSNFTSQWTKEFLRRMGCSPRFNTPGHPEAAGLVERCNSSLKTAIFKLCQGDPKGWHRLLPYVVWSLREVPNSTTHVSPHMLLFGTPPRGPLSVLKDSWVGETALPFSIGKRPEAYLQGLKENLEIAQAYADIHAEREQQRYANQYNLRSTDRKYQVGDKVVILSPVAHSGRKYYSRWHGPGEVVKVNSPYSYIVEVNDKRYHVHANKIRKFHERIDQAFVNNCAVIFDHDNDFGNVEVVEEVAVGTLLPSQGIDPAKLAHLTETQQRQLYSVIDKFADVFSEKPGFYPKVEHEIKITEDFKPKRLRAYKVPELLKPEVDRQIQELLDLGIIRPSHSEMASPVVCVLKGPNGENGVRLAVDFRYVNKYSAGDCYPTPDVADVLQKVSRASFISTFDAKSGYWQIPVKPESQWLTCFVCSSGLYEFVRMPFGLKSASNTFIRAIARILEPIRSFTEAFVDDMSVLSGTWEEHLVHLEKYLNVIKESGLTLGLKKCSFGQPKATFVGHVVGSGLIEPDPVKLSTIPNIQPPTTKREVRKLIGFFSYFRSFVPSLAETARVITDLTRKDLPNKVNWEPKHQEALDKLKTDLQAAVNTPLHSVEFGKDFGLLVDASLSAVGCCLIQWTEDGSEKPLSFASMKLSPTQSRWSTIEREAFAVIWALKKYRSWIFRAKVKVFSDHNPLTFLTEAAPKSSKLARWALALQEYNLEFNYRAGRRNAAADYLSRL